jgi:hypothetical protein
MGQYYYPIILREKPQKSDDDSHTNAEIIRTWFNPHEFDQGLKLMEHAYQDSPLMKVVESLIQPNSIFYKSRLVWGGDYADKEQGSDQNLHNMCDKYQRWSDQNIAKNYNPLSYPFLINHTRQEYVDKRKIRPYTFWPATSNPHANQPVQIHPLALLTAEGNGRGGGDYRGNDEGYCGLWARDIISVDSTVPSGYSETFYDFIEDSGYPVKKDIDDDDDDDSE